MFNFIIIKKLLNFWSQKFETDINIDIILHLKKNSLWVWYPIDTKSKSFSRLHPTVNILLIPLSTLGDRYVKQQFNRPTQRINIKAYKPIPRPIIHYPKDGQIKPLSVTTIIPHRWTRHSHVSRVEHRIKPIHCHSGVDYTPSGICCIPKFIAEAWNGADLSLRPVWIVPNRLLTSIRIKREGAEALSRCTVVLKGGQGGAGNMKNRAVVVTGTG